MIRLAVETATSWLGVAVMRNLEVLAECQEHRPMSQSAALMPAIRSTLDRSGLGPRGLEGIQEFALSSGPGSFTGLRIGAATVRTLADALGRPVVAVPTLLALACGAGIPEGPARAVLAGPRDQAVTQELRFQGGVPRAVGDLVPTTYLELAPEAARDGIWICDPVAGAALLSRSPGSAARILEVMPRAEWVGRYAHLAGSGVPAREFHLEYGKSPVYRKRSRPG